MVPSILYKYCPPERLDALESGLFRFTQPAAMNDPFDVSPFLLLGSEEFIREQVTRRVLDEYHNEGEPTLELFRGRPEYELFKGWAEEEMQAQIELEVKLWMRRIQESQGHLRAAVSEQIGVFCLTEDPNHILMWSHYAESHRGFVVGFDTSHGFFSQRAAEAPQFGLQPVQYANTRPGFSPDLDPSRDPMFVKSTAWIYEHEWRIVRPLAQADRRMKQKPFDICLFRIPPGAIKSVILGCNSTRNDQGRVLSLVERKKDFSHMEVLVARPHPSEYRLVIGKLNEADLLDDLDAHFL